MVIWGPSQCRGRSAIIYSLVVSCQRRGKDPLAYFRDVLTRLPSMTSKDDLQSSATRELVCAGGFGAPLVILDQNGDHSDAMSRDYQTLAEAANALLT